VPNNPYSCPPGPYERACMIAHFLKTKKPKSKLVIFDAKKTFSKQPAFEEAFAKYYGGIIDLNLTNEIDDFRFVRVDSATPQGVPGADRAVRLAERRKRGNAPQELRGEPRLVSRDHRRGLQRPYRARPQGMRRFTPPDCRAVMCETMRAR